MEQSDENLDMRISVLIEKVGDGDGHFKESDLYEIAKKNGISREEINKFLVDKSRSKKIRRLDSNEICRFNVKNLLKSFNSVIDEIYGAFLDCDYGLDHICAFLQKDHDTSKSFMNEDNFWESWFAYGEGKALGPNSITRHICTKRQLMERNSNEGINRKILGNLIIVQIYQYWEDVFRGKIADACRLEKKRVVNDIFGDIRLLRNAIVHNNGYLTIDSVNGIKIFKWFKLHEMIFLNYEKVTEIVWKLKGIIDKIVNRNNFGELGIKFGRTNEKIEKYLKKN